MRKLLFLMLAGVAFRFLAKRNPALARFLPIVTAMTSTGRRFRPR